MAAAFQSIGGMETVDGRVVRSGLLFRSAALNRYDDGGRKALHEAGITTVADLRNEDERLIAPDQLPCGIQYLTFEVLSEGSIIQNPNEQINEAKSHANTDEIPSDLYIQAYRRTVTLPSALTSYHRLFLSFAKEANLPLLVHCASGKDRTGWAAALLLLLLGVEEEAVIQDYLAFNSCAQPGDLHRKKVHREYIEAALDEVSRQFGTIETYFVEALQINPGQQEQLRILLTRPPANSP